MAETDWEVAYMMAWAARDMVRALDEQFPEHDARIVRLMQAYETAAKLLDEADEAPPAERSRDLLYVLMKGGLAIRAAVLADRASGAPDAS